jgi:hypothetical protein
MLFLSDYINDMQDLCPLSHPLLRRGEGRGKTFSFKIHVSSELKRALRKRQKKGLKKLAKANKGGTFAPATSIRSLTNWQVI